MALLAWTPDAAEAIPWQEPDFERDVAPILRSRCLGCHNETERSGGLDLSTAAGLSQGGDSGPVIEPGRPGESYLIDRIRDGEMPPAKQGKSQRLADEECARLERWVAAGASWPAGRRLDLFESTTETRGGRDWWSLQPIRRPPIPTLGDGELADNPVDAFILDRLRPLGLTPAPPADRRTLIRRISLDLIGLPPTPEEVEAFAADPSPLAYEKLVDRLLASPHYGERWGRFWLDVVRFAETCGYERDQVKPHAWKYRDYVIDSLNQDKPFDRFAIEQVAGDELPDRTEKTVIATGFHRLGTWNDEPNDPQEYKYERLEDLVNATSTAFLALTIKCARCHDHKFDPVSQADYYKMASAFWAGFIEPGPSSLLGGPDPATLGYDVLGWTDRGRDPPPLHLLHKGDPARPGPVVEPGPPSILPGLDRPFDPPPATARTTHRRLQLARWIVAPANPLTPRVWVNRIWQHHFGRGLVRSPDNFGFTGESPTHPELLDWLATEFTTGEWKTKPLHRLLVLSRTYRQSSVHPRQQEFAQIDAANRLWWRAERRRLDAETLHDALLTVSGRLDRSRIGGPSFLPEIPPEALEGLSMKDQAWTPSPPEQRTRRALYAFTKRGLLPPLFTTFDLPDTTLPCGQRDETLVAPQALALLNNAFVHEQSQAFADRIPSGTDPDRIRQAWRLALGRNPTPAELDAALRHLHDQRSHFARSPTADRLALASLCHVLINTNEFLYID